MASIVNRSNYLVTVEGKPERTRKFPFNKLKDAKQYERAQRQAQQADGSTPESVQLTQLEDNLLVRIRDKGYPALSFKARSYEEAEQKILVALADRAQGRRIDFNKARTVTLAQLFDRYIEEVCPRHKGCQTEIYILNSFLEDVGYESQYAKRKREAQTQSKTKRRHRARRIRRTNIEWLNKKFADVVPTDFQRYVDARLKQGIKPATIDREFDLISQVVNWAIRTLRYHVEISPFVGFERPRYFNERDRRLRGDEGERLLSAAREEDRLRSLKFAVEQELERIRAQGAPRTGKSWNKYFTMKARRQARATVEARGFLMVPFWEALFEYLLATTSRRSEALSLTWAHVYFEDKTAFYPDTKNGRSRTVPLRQHVVDLLRQLPRGADQDRVFPITEDELEGAWTRICKRAGVRDFHMHDIRHEGLSAAAEVGRAAGMPLDVIALSKLSGHRDLRMLARYSHLCAGELADRLDEAFERAHKKVQLRKGRVRVSGVRASTRPSAGATASVAEMDGSTTNDEGALMLDDARPARSSSCSG